MLNQYDLMKACPDCSREFALEQVEKGATLYEATLSFLHLQNARLALLNAEKKRLLRERNEL